MTLQELQLLDKQLEQVDIQLNFHLSRFAFELTGSRLQDKCGNKKLMQLGCENQHYSFAKNECQCEMSVCGWTLGSYERLSELYSIGFRSHMTLVTMGNDIMRRMGKDEYMQMLLREVQKCKLSAKTKTTQSTVSSKNNKKFEESKR